MKKLMTLLFVAIVSTTAFAATTSATNSALTRLLIVFTYITPSYVCEDLHTSISCARL